MKKYIFATSILMFAMLACSVSAATPPAPLPLVETDTTVPQIQFTSTSAPQVIPTSTVMAPPAAFTPLPSPVSGGPTVIQFAPGGTYTFFPDSIPSGSSKTYSINAMKGQVMSISVDAKVPTGDFGYIPMQIKGANGVVLCPQIANTDCTFWRGVLPASQNYFVTLTPTGNVPQFIMRVAINPPGKDIQVFQYNNPTTHLALTYTDLFAPAAFPSTANNKIQPELALEYIDSNIYATTNLGEAYFLLGSTTDPQIVATCTDPNPNGAGPEEQKGNYVVNGYTFVHSEATGVGAGNIYEQYIYRTVNQGVCYEVIFFIHYGNIGNYTPGTVKEFDENDLLQKFNGILSTFTVK